MDTETVETPQLGAPYGGGFFGGILLINGIRHGIAWAPKQYQFSSEILDCDRRVIGGAGSFSDSIANTRALLEAGSPAAKRVTELTINGHTDWAIPARDVVEVGYRGLKPTTTKNYCSYRDEENPSSVPPGLLYTPDLPAQTLVEAFREGGTEAFDEDDVYWSSTIDPWGYAFCQYFNDGSQLHNFLDDSFLVRAVRQIRLNP